ncbi:UDP-N-acetylglucosamine transferase subunit ALG14 homolog [Teleopsis dalmanni]|uniref:UDP-N-acetylglucosamine transferase subunit ALG14 homolog n=1 Tax=Teleopsis dalmanni TaxID=139649 RepID=UPI0018CDFAA3|nr:UDP-N-acetylglucosamine transferase subunit ALG14 homolog [Teleopsis dalmanni]
MDLNKWNKLEQNHPVYIILGSGGHTGEMCNINQALMGSSKGQELYKPIKYVLASSDTTSRKKIFLAMQKLNVTINEEDYVEVPRSREVGQSWLTTIFTALWALLWSFWLVWRDKPRLIICNGPGTCVPFCIAAFALRLLHRLPKNTKIIFIESFCRVKTLSLSGKLLLHIADMFVVQWPFLANKYKHKNNLKYFGRLI